MLPAINKHPDVTTPIALSADLNGSGDLADLYESGAVIIGETLDIDMPERDLRFVRSIPDIHDAELEIKKADNRDLLAKIDRDRYGSHILSKFFPGHIQAAGRLQAIIARSNEKIREQVRRLFPRYKFLQEHITWRLTVTEREPMHYDTYGGRDSDVHNVRLFVNLDDKPRLWGVGDPVWDMIRRYPDASLQAKGHPNTMNDHFSLHWPLDTSPRHFVSFAPGNAWLVNSQAVGHEIIFGRKMVACTFFVDHRTMADPYNGFAPAVRRALEAIRPR